MSGNEDSLGVLLGDSYAAIVELGLIWGESAAQAVAGPLSAADRNAIRVEGVQIQQVSDSKCLRDDGAGGSERDPKRVVVEID